MGPHWPSGPPWRSGIFFLNFSGSYSGDLRYPFTASPKKFPDSDAGASIPALRMPRPLLPKREGGLQPAVPAPAFLLPAERAGQGIACQYISEVTFPYLKFSIFAVLFACV